MIALAAALLLAGGCAERAMRKEAPPARAEDAPEIAREVHWREYKLPLRPEMASDAATAAERFGEIAAATAQRHGGVVEEARGRGKKTKKGLKPAREEVVVLDTADEAFRRQGFVLLRRGREDTRGRAASYELTLEGRAADIRAARAAPVESAAGVTSALDFKEEILIETGRPGGLRSSWTLESGVRKSERARDWTVADVVEVFPGVAGRLGNPSTPVAPVGGLRIEQSEVELPPIVFGTTAVRPSVTVWRDRDDGVIAAEYALTEKIADYWSQPAADVQAIRAYFSALQLAAPDWIAPGSTKAAAVYERSSARASR